MPKKVHIGVVGTGGIGKVHINAARECPGAEVTAVCDVDGERAQAAADEFGVPQVFTDYRALVASDQVDAVAVCTPNVTHMPVSLAAIKAGKDVLCEKPIAMNAREARRMVEAARTAGRVLMIGQTQRYAASSQYLKALADAGRFGEIYYGKALWLRRSGIPRGWFQDAAQSAGGPLIDLGVHAIDIMWWLMGRPTPIAAYGVTFDHLGRSGQGMGDWGVGYNPTEFSVEDLVGAMVRFEDGRALSIDIAWAAHTEDLYWLRIFGTKAGAQIQPQTVIYEADGEVKLDTAAKLPQRNPHAAEYEHFVDCIRGRREPMSPGAQGLVMMEMLDAIAKSARTGTVAAIRAR